MKLRIAKKIYYNTNKKHAPYTTAQIFKSARVFERYADRNQLWEKVAYDMKVKGQNGYPLFIF